MSNLKTYTTLDSSVLSILEDLEKQIFDENYQNGRLSAEAKSKDKILCILAFEDDQPVGFKLGYKLKEGVFYSWLGGVSKPHRSKGLASLMMKEQHNAVSGLGYKFIRTNGRNQYKDMLALNLKMGFDIIGTHLVTDEGKISISLEKRLN